jgi:hypothetical protein
VSVYVLDNTTIDHARLKGIKFVYACVCVCVCGWVGVWVWVWVGVGVGAGKSDIPH